MNIPDSAINDLSLVELAAYRRGAAEMAHAFLLLARADAPMEVINDLADKVANYSCLEDSDTPLEFLEESCRKFRFFSLFSEPDWIEEEETTPEGIPILPAYSKIYDGNPIRYLLVWCRHCFSWHQHGGGKKKGEGDGHRIAHCQHSSSPYKKGGYFIREVGKFPEGESRRQWVKWA